MDIDPLWLVEKRAIQEAIDTCDGNIPQAAGLLEVKSFNHLSQAAKLERDSKIIRNNSMASMVNLETLRRLAHEVGEDTLDSLLDVFTDELARYLASPKRQSKSD